MEAAPFSETSVEIWEAKIHSIPEDINLQEKKKSI
jgi:hypothetical protein